MFYKIGSKSSSSCRVVFLLCAASNLTVFLCHVIKPHSLIFSLQFGSRVDYTKLFVVVVVVIVVALVVK